MNINNSKLAPDTGKTNNDTNDVFGMDLYYNTNDGHLTSQVYYDGKMASAPPGANAGQRLKEVRFS